MPRSGLVQFKGHFAWTLNRAYGSVQADCWTLDWTLKDWSIWRYFSVKKQVFVTFRRFMHHPNNLVWGLHGGSAFALKTAPFLNSCMVLTRKEVYTSKSTHWHARVRLYLVLAWQLVLCNKVLGLCYFRTWLVSGLHLVNTWSAVGGASLVPISIAVDSASPLNQRFLFLYEDSGNWKSRCGCAGCSMSRRRASRAGRDPVFIHFLIHDCNLHSIHCGLLGEWHPTLRQTLSDIIPYNIRVHINQW
jgi:hypothetical protein